MKVREGKALLLIPDFTSEHTPSHGQVFYNPNAKISRDFSILAYLAYTSLHRKDMKFADPLAGIGTRAIRVALEVPNVSLVFINDVYELAVKWAKESAKASNVLDKCIFSVNDACVFLASHFRSKEKFDIVDVDPFGSPSRYIDCAIRALLNQGLLSVTATDTAVLCGIYERACIRKYGSKPIRCEYCHEVAIRILFGFIAREAARLELGIKPLFSHFTRNHVRCYLLIEKGARKADLSLDKIGFISHCNNCHERVVDKERLDYCPNCRLRMVYCGPLWIGEIHDKEFVSLMEKFIDSVDGKGYIYKILSLAREEIGYPATYYTLYEISSRLKLPAPKIDIVIKGLRNLGYKAKRASFNLQGFRTDAPSNVISKLINNLANTSQAN